MIGSIIGTIGQIGSSIYGAVQSSKLNKRAQQLLDEQMDSDRQWYEGKLNEDYMGRSDVQAALKKQRELLDKQYKQARATNVVAGGSDESLAMQKAAANESLSDTMTDIASAATSYKDALERQYRNDMATYNQSRRDLLTGQANAVAQAAGQTGTTFATLGSGINSLFSDNMITKKKV